MAGYLRFERLNKSHIPAILAIEAVNNTAPWSDKSFENELTHEHGLVLVALMDGIVVGFGALWLVIDEAHVINISVADSHKRQGIGRRLMLELIRLSQERGMTCSTLEVRASNTAALELYRRLGFQSVATRKGYYPDNKEDAIVMWLYDLQTWEPPTP